MARRLVYTLQSGAPQSDTLRLYDTLATAVLGTFDSLSQQRLAQEHFLFVQWCYDRAEEMKFGLEPGLTHALLTSLLAGAPRADIAELTQPFNDHIDAVRMGFNLGDPLFAIALMDGEMRLFAAWRALSAL